MKCHAPWKIPEDIIQTRTAALEIHMRKFNQDFRKWRIWKILVHFNLSATSSCCVSAKGRGLKIQPLNLISKEAKWILSFPSVPSSVLAIEDVTGRALAKNDRRHDVPFSSTYGIKYCTYFRTASIARPCADEEKRLLYLQTLGGQISTWKYCALLDFSGHSPCAENGLASFVRQFPPKRGTKKWNSVPTTHTSASHHGKKKHFFFIYLFFKGSSEWSNSSQTTHCFPSFLNQFQSASFFRSFLQKVTCQMAEGYNIELGWEFIINIRRDGNMTKLQTD